DAEPRRALELIADYEEELSAYARAKFAERRAHVRLYGRPPERNRLPLFAFNVAGVPSLELAERFQRARIEARVGDFNSPRLLRSLAPETGGIAVRLSFAHYNSTEEIDRCFDVIDAAGETPAESFNESDVPERATR
ncbi:MAG: aminotransferase class V-fold PLP-dependent enzyme, partial [Candidatus Eremiobacteraeota bacterium]|nr:aminotransferase class V-fold PLP-dependent enzyme [Candidatus Eremiobacteraeota bacterium]